MQPSVDDLFRSAHAFHCSGKIPDAERLYRLILSRDPTHAGALNFLGVIALEAGHVADAQKLMRRSVDSRPHSTDFRINFSEALRRGGDIAGAVEQLKRAIELEPRDPSPYARIALILSLDGRDEECLPLARKAIELAPTFVPAMLTLAQALIELSRLDEARAVLDQALRVDPAHATARFLHAAATGAGGASVPATPPPGFTAGLFDGCAHRFDQHLVAGLTYRGPEQLREAIDRLRPQGQFDILDLGCGTGLVGMQFRDRARSMVGVDVSERMLEIAFSRGIYQRLERGELLASLQARDAEFDLILAGDVFIYVGELAEVFPATRRALRPDGLFAFTVERHDEGDGFILRPSRRYAHSQSYIESLATRSGLELLAADHAVLRVERGQQVHGITFVLRRPATPPA